MSRKIYEHMKYLAMAGGMFAKWLESSTILSVCKQQWSMVHLQKITEDQDVLHAGVVTPNINLIRISLLFIDFKKIVN